ncbi:DUF2800 domain-containing protein [Anaerobacillus sp. HL2]|nr:DUF2800 domain-containing protein [Anaerobacillus sp. HL2]
MDYSAFVPEGFGTVDGLKDYRGHFTSLISNMVKPVSAENNSQMKLYAIGAITSTVFIPNQNYQTCNHSTSTR